VQVGALTNWLHISASRYSTASIKTDGTLWIWGSNYAGTLGLGDTIHRSSPVQVGALTTWSKLAIPQATYSRAAIKTDGTLWTWGSNGSGQLGVGDTANRGSPVQVGANTNWVEVVQGVASKFALTPQ
jgi:alpha-tubulin suppressor-like RCC1 family protein